MNLFRMFFGWAIKNRGTLRQQNIKDDALDATPLRQRAAWVKSANDDELRRLARIQSQVDALELRVNGLIAERQLIMNRCIRRMRRSEGKN